VGNYADYRRITKVIHATNLRTYAQWRTDYINFSGKIANNYSTYGTVYAAWYNDTGVSVNVSITVQNKCGEYDTASGTYFYVSTSAYSMEDPEKVFGYANEDPIYYRTSSKTVTVPSGYYLTWFNQNDAYTIVTARIIN